MDLLPLLVSRTESVQIDTRLENVLATDEKPAIHEVTLMFCDYGNGRLRLAQKGGMVSTVPRAKRPDTLDFPL